jgi:ABC-type sugar transport system ATPase subunit
MQDILIFEGITKSFPGVKALDDVSLSIRKGEIHAVVGENGAGKSTLMNLLGGEYHPDDGVIRLEGKPIAVPSPYASRKLGISIVYQELKLCPNLTVVENIFLGREREGNGRRVNWKKLSDAAAGILQSLGAPISPRELVERLSISEQSPRRPSPSGKRNGSSKTCSSSRKKNRSLSSSSPTGSRKCSR